MRSEDIARLAGVSRSTVSRVLNNYPDIPQKTREKVLKIIEQYNYVPNNSARTLAGKSTNTIGFFAVSMGGRDGQNRIYQNHYLSPFVDAVIDKANAAGYYVLVHTVYASEDFDKVRQAFRQKRIDGGIVVGIRRGIDTVKELVGLGKPLVMIDYDVSEILAHHLDEKHFTVINSRDYEGASEAVQALIDLGHRRIGFIGDGGNTWSGQQRYEAYRDTLQKNGLEVEEAYVLNGHFQKDATHAEVANLLDRCGAGKGNADGAGKLGGTSPETAPLPLPTAFFAANDDMAIGALEALRERGLSVPDDVSLIGFDDSPVSAQLQPALSTVRLPIYDMSRAAVEQLVAMCEQSPASFSTASFPTGLVMRESCRRLTE
jgi:LacI family transcriptional regulator